MEHWKLVRPRTVRVPTWRGGLLLLLVTVAVTVGMVRGVFPFLAVTDRVATDVLVVEGWVPDFVLRTSLEEFQRGGYREVYVTGGPLEKGDPLYAYGSYAELGRATFERLGVPASALHAVPAPKVKRDRTYTSAVALRDYLRRQGRAPGAFNVITTDAHARRTRLLFEQAFAGEAMIGIIAAPDERYDGSRWWRSSNGVRTVSDEVIGYLYARFLFSVADDLAAFRG
jgi:hypothetical protein